MSELCDLPDAIRVIVFNEGDMWAAQCLEYDIGAQANTLEELKERIEAAIDAECRESLARNGARFAGILPAPSHYERMWNKQAGRFTPETSFSDHSVEYALCA